MNCDFKKNFALFPTHKTFTYCEDLRKLINKSMNKHNKLKPLHELPENHRKVPKNNDGVAFLKRIEREKNPFKKKDLANDFQKFFFEQSSNYQNHLINDVNSFFKSNGSLDEILEEFRYYLPLRDDLLSSYADSRLGKEFLEFDKFNVKSYDLKRSVLVKVRDLDSGDLYSLETSTSKYLSDESLRNKFNEIKQLKDSKKYFEKDDNFFPSVIFDNDNVELFSSHNITRIILDKNVRGATWEYDSKNHVFFEIHTRNKSARQELVKLVDTIIGRRSEWFFDVLGSNEIMHQQRLYDSVNKIKQIKSIANVDYRNIPNNYNAKAFNKIVKDAEPFLRRSPNNAQEHDLWREHLLKGIWVDHSLGETICMTPAFHDWYVNSPISHNKSYLNERESNRKKYLISNCCDFLSQHLEFSFMSFNNSSKKNY